MTGGTLHHRLVRSERQAPDRWLFFLHGFLGAGRNWASVARGLVRARPDWGGVLVDLRLHGRSTELPPPHTIRACAQDVRDLVARLAPPEHAVLGHSFGGKVALAAGAAGSGGLRQIWMIDSTPDPGRTSAGATELLELLGRLPASFRSRREAADRIEEAGYDRVVAEWLATNLELCPGGYVWRFKLADLEMLLADFFRADLWPVVTRPPPGVEIVAVRATRDTILSDAATRRIEGLHAAGRPVQLVTLDGGHWLNMENPTGLLRLLRQSLPGGAAGREPGS